MNKDALSVRLDTAGTTCNVWQPTHKLVGSGLS